MVDVGMKLIDVLFSVIVNSVELLGIDDILGILE